MAPNFPTTYDDYASMFGPSADFATFILDGAINDTVTTFYVKEGYSLYKLLSADSHITMFAKGQGPDTFTGVGLDDLTVGGTFVGFKKKVDYRVNIDGTGTPDTFEWSNDGGVTWEAQLVGITGSAQALEEGITITFAATTGHTVDERWDWSAGFEIILLDDVTPDLDAAIADDGGAFTDETTPAKNATADDMTLLPAVPAVDDAYYFGRDHEFDSIRLDISTAGAGTWTITWEYWDGTSWDPLTMTEDETTGFTIGGTGLFVRWSIPGDWATTTVNSQGPFYYVRARVSAYTSITTQPLGQQTWALAGEVVTCTRASDGSTALSHADLAVGVHDPIASHFSKIRDALIAAETYKGLVGTSPPGTAAIGEFYINTSTSKWLATFAADTWSTLNRPDHGEYGALGADDHTNLQIESRKITWHTALTGDHLTNPTTHAHSGGATDGDPVAKFETGLEASRPGASSVGQVYYGYDENNVYFSPNGSTWIRYTTMPKGTLMYFEGGCPVSWTTQTALDDKLLKGAPTGIWSGLVSGGTAVHSHEMPDLIAHQHSVVEKTGVLTPEGDGNHRHTIAHQTGDDGSNRMHEKSSSSGPLERPGSDAGAHTHSATVPVDVSDNAGTNPANTNTRTTFPSYKNLRMCRKD